MRGQRNLNRLAYFAAVVEHGSFTAASDRLGITKAVVSQQVARLEKETGAALLIRTTRRVQPTEAGRIFYARCLAVLREADSAFEEVAQAGARPMGLLRVAAPLDFGITAVIPAAASFRNAHPECDVSLLLEDRVVDLLREKVDVSIRVGWLADSSYKARRIGSFRQLVVCTPRLAATLKRPAGPQALAGLAFIANAVLRNPLAWRFTKGHETCSIKLEAALSVNATMAARAAVLAEGGFSILPDYLVASDLRDGALVELFANWRLPNGGIFLVFPNTQYRPPKTTAFVEVLSRQLAGR